MLTLRVQAVRPPHVLSTMADPSARCARRRTTTSTKARRRARSAPVLPSHSLFTLVLPSYTYPCATFVCPDGGAPVIVSIVGVFVLICALSLLRFLFTTASVRFKRVGVAARILTSALVRVGPSKLKLAITFYQVTAAIPKTFDIDPLPADFSQVLSSFTWVEFDLAEITYPTGCM